MFSRLVGALADGARSARTKSRVPDKVGIDLAHRSLWLSTSTWHTANFCLGKVRGGRLYYEPQESRLFKAVLPGKRVFFDVGAHIGYYSLLAAASQPDLNVFAFEMLDGFGDEIERHVRANDLSNVELIRSSVADGRETIEFGNFAERASKASICLDGFCSERDVYPDLIKMDIEGNEHLALIGAQELLQSRRPDILLGLHPGMLAEKKSSANDVLRLLRDIGYHVYFIVDQLELESSVIVIPVEGMRDLVESNTNLLCLSRPLADCAALEELAVVCVAGG